ncbi:MAG: GNAT family N-acetyltransferase [Ruminococcus sp.]|nr:GNAT family N-acetyltransferase [Ruminococcus sp.]
MKNCDSSRSDISPLFAGFEDSVLYSYFEGRFGRGFCNEERTAGAVVCGSFYFAAGDVCAAGEVLELAGGDSKAVFMPCGEGWLSALIERDSSLAVSPRFRTGCGNLDIKSLKSLRDIIGAEYEIKSFDRDLLRQAVAQSWSEPFLENFAGPQDFMDRGFGVAAIKDGELVCGASSYTLYSKGAEVEIACREDHRRRGLATAVGAAFILECLRRGLRPHWDAGNMISLKIAQRLGFELKEEYLSAVREERTKFMRSV